MFSQISGSSARSIQSGARYFWNKRLVCLAIQELVWIPLVMWVIGTSFSALSGHNQFHIFLDTSPCNSETEFMCSESLSARTGMTNVSPQVWACFPKSTNWSLERFNFGQICEKYLSINQIGNWSFPAGTGVWVVNTLFFLTISAASSKVFPVSIISRIRSKARKAEWPSFMCQTVGLYPKIRNARTPPIPNNISCEILTSRSLLYNLEVNWRSLGEFSSRSESSKYKKFLPILTCHIRAKTALPGKSMEIVSGLPCSSVNGIIGTSE